jgi:outer membrane protein OmpA-like peptidoglycan-associated protein
MLRGSHALARLGTIARVEHGRKIMRRLLCTTAALSLVLAPLQPLSLSAQTLAEDGSLLAEDGSVLCPPGNDTACDLETILKTLAEQGQTEISPATLEALTTALAARAAGTGTDEQAAAEAARQAEAAAAAEAEAKAAEDEAAAAEAARQAEAAAAAEAEAKAAGDEAAVAEAARQAEAAAAEAEAKAAEDAAAVTEAARQAEAAAAEAEAKAATEQAAAPEPAPEPAPETAPVAEAEVIPLEDLPQETQQAFEAAQAAEAAAVAAPVAEAEATPVDVPVVTDEEVATLSTLLGGPETATEAVGAAAGLLGALSGDRSGTTEPPAVDPEADVSVTTITEADARSSFEDFADAPKLLEGGQKKSGLSDLEKAGLLALGAIVVGNLLSDGREVVANTGDRVVVRQPDGNFQVYKDDDTLLRRPGSTVRTETYGDGSTRTLVERQDGTQVVTIRDATGRVLRRAVYDDRGLETILIDDLEPEERIDVSTLPAPRPSRLTISANDEDAGLRAELARIEAQQIGRSFSLRQVREVPQVRKLAAVIDVDNITFDSGSAVIRTTEARKLSAIGRTMNQLLEDNPDEVFLIEGHTDAVGSASSNLTLSDRRAESVALALTEYFGIPPENLVVQGYGEYDLRIDTLVDERLNRRAAVRVITPLLRTASLR